MSLTRYRKARLLIAFLALSLLYVGGSVGGKCGNSTDDSSTSDDTTSSLTFSSEDITSGGTIASTFANSDCSGDNKTPQLSWSSPPDGTMSYAITILDTSFNNYIHWIVYNIPISSTSIAQNAALPSGATAGPNGNNASAYTGPCPDSGETHTYQFKIWALDTANLSTVADIDTSSGSSILTAIQAHDLDSASFNATFTGP